MKDVVAVLCADIHLSHLPPKFRRAESNWYAAMARTLEQVRAVVEEFKVPLVCAGDIFDDGWRVHKCPPELLNFAIKHLPTMYAVPGQHDLPNHRYQDIMRSGYWTLVEAKIVRDLHPSQPVAAESLVLYGFPWGAKLNPVFMNNDLATHVAVIHHYVWAGAHGFQGASNDDHTSTIWEKIKEYDAAVFGDNHKGFTSNKIYNCGGLMVRKSDELAYRPAVGLLMRDGTTERRFLDTSMDRYAHDDTKDAKGPVDTSGVKAFVGELNALANKPMFDLKDAFDAYYRTHQVSDKARERITKGMAK